MLTIHIRTLEKFEVPHAQAFYRQFGNNWKPKEKEQVWIATRSNDIIGIVRVSEENNYPILRGMFVAKDCQRQGVGSQLLKAIAPCFEGKESFCLPYLNLSNYYGQIGFEQIENEAAPLFLQQRLKEYSERFDQLIIMKRSPDY